MLTIDTAVARRFVLGKQGLWPGRRWQGIAGTTQAMRAMAYVQLDPLQITARSHDIALHGRVLDYRPNLWEEVTYAQRQFFDWGGWLPTRPMADLPYWRVVMHRERDGHPDCDPRVRKMGQDHAETVAEMRTLLQENGAVTNRDFEMTSRKRTQSYRGRKDSSVALYYLWRTGEVMTHHRQNFERVYALAETVAPPDLVHKANAAEALADLSAGRVPSAWMPPQTDTTAEAVFLAPLDVVSARGRAKELFGFDYVWEVYKPAHKHRFGYYTLPVLWGDQLVARFDSRLDRETNTFVVLGFWLEDYNLAADEAFAEALARGFARFVAFLDADRLDAGTIEAPLLRKRVADGVDRSRQ